MAKKPASAKNQKGPGRPPVKVKKKPFQIMLDPRYINHFRKIAQEKQLQPQDLARIALNAFVPDPFHPFAYSKEMIPASLSKKKKSI